MNGFVCLCLLAVFPFGYSLVSPFNDKGELRTGSPCLTEAEIEAHNSNPANSYKVGGTCENNGLCLGGHCVDRKSLLRGKRQAENKIQTLEYRFNKDEQDKLNRVLDDLNLGGNLIDPGFAGPGVHITREIRPQTFDLKQTLGGGVNPGFAPLKPEFKTLQHEVQVTRELRPQIQTLEHEIQLTRELRPQIQQLTRELRPEIQVTREIRPQIQQLTRELRPEIQITRELRPQIQTLEHEVQITRELRPEIEKLVHELRPDIQFTRELRPQIQQLTREIRPEVQITRELRPQVQHLTREIQLTREAKPLVHVLNENAPEISLY